MQYYHFRSTRSVFTDLEDCDDSNKRRPKTVLWSISSKQIYYPYESKFLACCFAFFKWARLRRAGDKRVDVSRSTPASFSMKHAKVLQTSKFLIIYTTPVVHWPAWLSDQSEFWCLLHSPMRNRERRRKLERKGVPNIKLFLGSFFFCCCCFFVYFVFVCFFFFPVSINSPRSLCKRLSFLLKTEREPRPRPHAFRYFWKRKFFFLLKMYASTRCVIKWFVLLFIFPFNTKTLKRCNHSRIPYRGCAVRWMTSGHSREDLCFRASTWRRQFGVFIRLHSAEDCFRKPASLHWCPKLKHPLPVNRRIKQRENIWIRVDGALDRSLLIDVCPLNTNYKTCLVIKPSLKNEK